MNELNRRRVEHADIDAFGVVHFSKYAAFMEEALLDHMEGFGAGLKEVYAHGIELRVRELQVRYLSAARYRDSLRFVTELERLGAVFVRMQVHIFRDDPEAEMLARGLLDIAFVDKSSGKPTPLPESLAKRIRGTRS